MAYKTIQHVSVPNLNLFRTELRAQQVGEFSIMLYGKMGWCRNINVWKFSKL